MDLPSAYRSIILRTRPKTNPMYTSLFLMDITPPFYKGSLLEWEVCNGLVVIVLLPKYTCPPIISLYVEKQGALFEMMIQCALTRPPSGKGSARRGPRLRQQTGGPRRLFTASSGGGRHLPRPAGSQKVDMVKLFFNYIVVKKKKKRPYPASVA